MPRRKVVHQVAADDEEELRIAIRGSQLTQCGDRVARTTAANLCVADFQPWFANHQRTYHRQPVGCGGDDPLRRLLPRIIGHHQQHMVECQRITCRFSDGQVAYVWRIEGAAEHPETLRHAQILGVMRFSVSKDDASVLHQTAQPRRLMLP